MQPNPQSKKSILVQAVVFTAYLVGGVAVFFFGSNYFRRFATNMNPLYEWGITLGFLLLAVLLRKNPRLEKFWPLPYALFTAAFGNALMGSLGNWLGQFIPVFTDAQAMAVDKLAQAIPLVLSMILFSLLGGDDLGAIFLKKGRLKQGLLFGLISFGIFVAIFTAIAVIQSNAPVSTGLFASGVSLNTILSALPWILVFVFANSMMEELWFRGISLNKLTPHLGVPLTVILTSLVFASTHIGATYISPVELVLFPAIVFALGLVNGFAMLKTDSIWGSVLFHAGYDLLIIIPVLVTM